MDDETKERIERFLADLIRDLSREAWYSEAVSGIVREAQELKEELTDGR